MPLPHPTRTNDLKFASKEKSGTTFVSSSVFYTSSVLGESCFWGYVFVHARTYANVWDDNFGYYRNVVNVLSTLQRLTTSL